MAQSDFDYYKNLGKHPMTGEKDVSFQARIAKAPYLEGYFNGDPKCEQVKNVTPGKVYDIYKAVCYGDCASFCFKDDSGSEQRLSDFFFEDINADKDNAVSV